MERRTRVLGEEVESFRVRLAVPEVRELKSVYGLGPAASKIYGVEQGLSIGGYGEWNLQTFHGDVTNEQNKADILRTVLYFGFKFSDRFVLNSEFEFEHGTTSDTKSSSEGAVSVEFAYLDWLIAPPINFRVGGLLIPVGFLNEVHEPPFFHGVIRPSVERQIIPTTWREIGAGFFGEPLPGLEYRAYVVNGLNAKGFSKSNIRGARQKLNRVRAEDFALTGRLDYTRMPGLLVGGSFFLGDSGQDQKFAGKRADVDFLMGDFHAQYRFRGLELRGLLTAAHIGDADQLSNDPDIKGPISRTIWGWYAEAAYNILPHFLPETGQFLLPFVRWEQFNTQADVPDGFTPDRSKDNDLFTIGLTYKPIPNIVFKADYRNFFPDAGVKADEFNFGVGFVF